jgi:hypothetical protein
MFPVLLSHNLTVVALCLSVAFFFAESTIGPFWAIPMDIAPRFSGSASGLMKLVQIWRRHCHHKLRYVTLPGTELGLAGGRAV